MVEKQALSRVVIFELIQAVQINWELNALAWGSWPLEVGKGGGGFSDK